MKLIKISIIIPIYNSEKYLEKCLDSVINQTHRNIEIILVNDGSQDNSIKICEAYSKKDRRILLINQNNQGVSAARNRGIENASGDYIGFIDSDDYISLDMYEKLVDFALKYNADIVECGVNIIDTKNNILSINKLKEELVEGNYSCCFNYVTKTNTTNYNVNKIYKESIIKNLRYPNYRYSEDYYINNLAFLKCHRKVTINDCCYFYLKHPNSASQKQFNVYKLDIIKSGKEVLKIYNKECADLSIFIVLYILNNIRTLYVQVMNSDISEAKVYRDILIKEYKDLYKQWERDFLKSKIPKKNLIALKLFKDYRFIHDFIEKFIYRRLRK